MIETMRNAWKIPELRKKILFTAFALLIFRLDLEYGEKTENHG